MQIQNFSTNKVEILYNCTGLLFTQVLVFTKVAQISQLFQYKDK